MPLIIAYSPYSLPFSPSLSLPSSLHIFTIFCSSLFIHLRILIYSSNFLLFSHSLSLLSSYIPPLHFMPTQLKSLYPFLFGDSGSDHSKMQGFVRKLQKVEIRSTEYVKSVTSIPITHMHMHMVRYVRT